MNRYAKRERAAERSASEAFLARIRVGDAEVILHPAIIRDGFGNPVQKVDRFFRFSELCSIHAQVSAMAGTRGARFRARSNSFLGSSGVLADHTHHSPAKVVLATLTGATIEGENEKW